MLDFYLVISLSRKCNQMRQWVSNHHHLQRNQKANLLPVLLRYHKGTIHSQCGMH